MVRKSLCCLGMMLLISGCSIISSEPYHQTHTYDIGVPVASQVLSVGKSLSVRNFRSAEPYWNRMVFRKAGIDIEFGEYNRWSCPPAKMLERYFIVAFDNSGKKPDVTDYLLSGEILQIEADMNRKTANLIVVLTLTSPANGDFLWQKVYRQEIPLDDITGKSFARGTKSAVDNIIQLFVQDLKTIK